MTNNMVYIIVNFYYINQISVFVQLISLESHFHPKVV